MRGRGIGPLSFRETVNINTCYQQMLRQLIFLEIEVEAFWFQQDRAPADIANSKMEMLQELFDDPSFLDMCGFRDLRFNRQSLEILKIYRQCAKHYTLKGLKQNTETFTSSSSSSCLESNRQ
jgi:hypothetical protein